MKKERTKRNKKNILITGATGHLGSFLLGRIPKNYNIFTVETDIANRNKLAKYKKIFEKTDILIHLAAYVPLKREFDDLNKSIDTNVKGSLNLVDLLKKGSKLIFANTCEIYNPQTFYAVSKLVAERQLGVICREKGIKFISLRFASIYGPGEKIQRAIPNFIKSAIKNEDITIFGDGKEKRSYLYIDDAVEAIVRAIAYPRSGIFNISSREVITIAGLAKLIKKITKSKSKIVYKPRIKEKKDLVFSGKEAEKKLKFRSRFTLGRGIKEEINYFDKPTLFLDLDGTVFDVSERVYRAYQDTLKKHKKKFLKKKEYLELKKKKTPIGEILQRTGAEDVCSKFTREYERKIENARYLKLDKISQGLKKMLLDLKDDYRLVLFTLRKHPSRLFEQLKKKGVDKIFNKILLAPAKNSQPKWESKSKIIRQRGNYNKKSVIVGDTETDILAGKSLGLKTIAVVNGMRNRNFLKKYKPDVLIDDFLKLKHSI